MSFSKTFLATFIAVVAAAVVIVLTVKIYNEHKHQRALTRQAAAIIRHRENFDLYTKLLQAPTVAERDKIIDQIVALHHHNEKTQKYEREEFIADWESEHQAHSN
jgi:putative exporter of polyketide antibiotics